MRVHRVSVTAAAAATVASVVFIGGLAAPASAGVAPANAPVEKTDGWTLRPGPGTTIESDQTTLTITPRGDAEVDRHRENRWFRHFPHDPVGRYVEAGEQLVVSLPAGTPNMQLTIGQYGGHTGINGGASTGLSYHSVGAGQTTVQAPIDGLVYLWNRTESPIQATVAGGDAVPTFILGETSEAEFAAAMAQHTASPLVVVEGERIFGAFQRRLLASRVDRVTPARVASWDDAVEVTDAVYGLDVNASGLHRKSAARVFIANPDGGGINATHNRISFGYNGAARLFDRGLDTQWGLWHEIGHTYQTPHYRWAGLTEVTVNISPLAIQADRGLPSNLDPHRTAIDNYLAQPDEDKDFDGIANGWVKLAMFDGLREQFGDDFYPTLNRIYREQFAAGELSVPTSEAKKQHFMVTAGQAAQHNLSDYFVDWGMAPTAQTLAALAEYPG